MLFFCHAHCTMSQNSLRWLRCCQVGLETAQISTQKNHYGAGWRRSRVANAHFQSWSSKVTCQILAPHAFFEHNRFCPSKSQLPPTKLLPLPTCSTVPAQWAVPTRNTAPRLIQERLLIDPVSGLVFPQNWAFGKEIGNNKEFPRKREWFSSQSQFLWL